MHLTRFLRRNKHTTPSESVEIQAEQKTPVFVWPRQGGRHRTTDKESVLGTFIFLQDFYQIPDEQIRKQSKANRQGRGNKLEDRTQRLIRMGLEFCEESQIWAQEELSDRGIPLEVSDADKGVGFYTRGTIKTDLHNALHFLGLRNNPHAQHEIQVNAAQFENFVQAVAPWSHQSFLDYERNAMKFTAPELPLVGRMLAESRTEIPLGWYKKISWTNTNGTRGREAKELDEKIKQFSGFMKEGKGFKKKVKTRKKGRKRKK